MSEKELAVIARRAGVSTRTVYRVLNQRLVERRAGAAARAERIRALAAELGYRPNQAARSTRSGCFDAAGLLLGVTATRSVMPMNFLPGLHDRLAAAGKHLVVARERDEALGDAGFAPTILQRLMVDGLVVYYTHGEPAGLEEALEEHGVPAIWANARRRDDCISFDDQGGAVLAIEHLLHLGHRRIGYLSLSRSTHHSTTDRLAGYGQAMRKARLPVETMIRPTVHAAEGGDEDHPDLVRAWLARSGRPTAVLCSGSHEAVACLVAAGRLGLRVPGDLSLIHIDQSLADHAGAGLTRAHASAVALGRGAAELLLEKIATPARQLPARVLTYELWSGRSCAPPGSG